MMSRKRYLANQRGAVSLFIVVFTALLVVTISVAFIRIMVQDQQQATANDLSKSAMDSALAGVEDAKRAIVDYRDNCVSGPDTNTTRCVNLRQALGDGMKCDTLQRAGIVDQPDPVAGGWLIRQNQSQNDEALQQAYTCVKIQMNTPDYLGKLTPDTSALIPLDATSAFNEVVVEWYTRDDLQNALEQDGDSAGTISQSTDLSLPKQNDWPSNRPALLRTQLIQFGREFELADFDFRGSDDSAEPQNDRNAATLFLFPLAGIPDDDGTNLNFASDVRDAETAGALQYVSCDKSFSMTEGRPYACKATIAIPNPVDEDDTAFRNAYLRINMIYNTATDFSVSLKNSGTSVNFNGVQPMVDSTGRANDLFRRVQSRVKLETERLSDTFPTPSIDVTNGLCKSFRVTDREYRAGICEDRR